MGRWESAVDFSKTCACKRSAGAYSGITTAHWKSAVVMLKNLRLPTGDDCPGQSGAVGEMEKPTLNHTPLCGRCFAT